LIKNLTAKLKKSQHILWLFLHSCNIYENLHSLPLKSTKQPAFTIDATACFRKKCAKKYPQSLSDRTSRTRDLLLAHFRFQFFRKIKNIAEEEMHGNYLVYEYCASCLKFLMEGTYNVKGVYVIEKKKLCYKPGFQMQIRQDLFFCRIRLYTVWPLPHQLNTMFKVQ